MDPLLAAARADADRGQVDRALATLADAHALAPERSEPVRLALEILDRIDAGPRIVFWGERALRLDPFDIFFNAATAYGLELVGEVDRAVVYWRRAHALHGGPHAFALQLGRCLMHIGDIAGADAVLTAAMEAEVDAGMHAMLERTLGEAWLKGADISGFLRFQARDRSDGAAYALPDVPTWGGEDLAGRTLLITHHLGYGDQMMLAPMAALIARRAGRLVMTCDEGLHALLAASLPDVTVLALARPTRPDMPAPAALAAIVAAHRPDAHASLLGACAQLTVDEVTEASSAQRLVAPAASLHEARRRLANLRRMHPGKRLIGLAFDCDQHRMADMNAVVRASALRRSVPVDAIVRLARALEDSCRFVCLHPPAHAARIGALPPPIEIMPGGLADFAETAGAIQALDGVLTVDCSVANLAGKLGGPTWAMLNRAGEWRWGVRGETTLWFPGMRLLRQRIPGDWDGVVDAVAAALKDR